MVLCMALSHPSCCTGGMSFSRHVCVPWQELREHVHGQLAAHCAPGAASVPGKAWVRGWDDSQKAPARPQQAE